MQANPTPVPSPTGGGGQIEGCFGFVVLRGKAFGAAGGGTGFRRFDGGSFAGVGRQLVRGGVDVGGRFGIGAGMESAAPTPTLPRCASLRGRGQIG